MRSSSSHSLASYKTGAKTSWVIFWPWIVDERGAAAVLIMTVKTETEKPVLTYSKSRGLVALVTGTDHNWIFLQTFFQPSFCILMEMSKHSFCFSPFLCSFHETKEDGPERLHSAARHKLLRLQAVSTI